MPPKFPQAHRQIGVMALTLLLAATLACGDGTGSGLTKGSTPPGSNPWTNPLPLENWTATDAQDPSVALDYVGNAIVTWNGKSSTGSNSSIWANNYSTITDWTGYTRVGSLTGDASDQKIAMNNDGLATIVWTQGTGTGSIQSFRYSPVTGFMGLTEPVSATTRDAMTPAVAVDQYGNAIATWVQSDGTHYHTWACRYMPSSGWDTPLQLDSNLGEESRYPAVAMDPSGDAVVIWHQSADLVHGPYSVQVRHYWAGQGWSTSPVNLDLNHDAWNPAIALSNDGAQAVWEETTDNQTTIQVYTSRYTSLGGWSDPVRVSSTSAKANWPSVAIDASGNSIVTWAQTVATDSYAAMATRYSPLGGWEVPASFVNGDSGASAPVVSMNAGGTAVIAWSRTAGSNTDIYAVRYLQGWGNPYLVSPDAGGQASFPSVCVGGDGHIRAAWMQQDQSTTIYHVLTSDYQISQ